MWLDDGEINPLTIGSSWDYKPNTSPDKQWIAFSRAEESASRIWLIPATGGKGRQLTDTPYDDRWPTWSETGDRLLFHRVVERGTAIKSFERKSGKVRTLVGEQEQPLQASFDPTARRVVFCAQTDDRKLSKFSMSHPARFARSTPGRARPVFRAGRRTARASLTSAEKGCDAGRSASSSPTARVASL